MHFQYQDAPVISVTVQWSELTFQAQTVQWNPEQHLYTVSDFVPTGSNSIAVISNAETNVTVYADFSYTPRALYPDILASFTDAQGNPITQQQEVPKHQTLTAYLNLSGSADVLRLMDFGSGSCSVSITNTPKS